MPKFFAPYKKFRARVDGLVLYFPRGSRFVQDDNQREIDAIKRIPIALGEIKDADGNVVNLPQEDTLENKTVPELRDYADLNGVDLAGATKKADIIEAIVSAEAEDVTAD